MIAAMTTIFRATRLGLALLATALLRIVVGALRGIS